MFNRFNYSFCFIFVVLSLSPFFALSSSASTQATLEWSQNSEPDLAGYRVFTREEGQQYDYIHPSWEGIETTCTIYDLDETKTNYFVARAFDMEEFESADSNEIFLEPEPVVEIDNIIITSAVYNAKKDTISITAASDAPADSVVLTAWVDFGMGAVELGNLRYSQKKRIYSKTFRKVNELPNMVIITSSGGGYDDKGL